MAALTVGPGLQFQTVGAAVAASHDGDTIYVQAGTYVNDGATINTKISIVGVGGMAHFVGNGMIGNGKAFFVTNTDVTFDHIEFSGAKVADHNGAGIRYQAGNLTITNCYFHDNEEGILGASSPGGTIKIDNSEFAHNGYGDGQTHNIYIGTIDSLAITDSYIHDAVVGHEIKSRAAVTTIENNRIVDGAGTASYSIDLPNGGIAIVRNNIIQQGPNSENQAIISYAAEQGQPQWANSQLQIENNTVVNERVNPIFVVNHGTVTAAITDNDLFGLSAAQIGTGPNTQSNNTFLTTKPSIDASHPWGASPWDDIVWGGASSNILTGSAAHDLFVGGPGADTFVIKAGGNNDTIANFQAGTGGSDVVRLEGLGLIDFSKVVAAMTQHGADTVLNLGQGQTLTFQNVQVGSFAADDFVITNSAPPPTKPTEAVSTVKFSADTGTSSSDFVTNTASQTISGTLNAALASGDVVKVSLNNGTTWQTATATTGSTTFSLSGVTLTGSNTLQARVEDSAGNFSTAKTQAYVLDKTAPTEAVSTVKFSADTGTSSSDFVTNTASQMISGTLNAALASGDVVKVSLNNGTTWQTATATTGSTTFSLSGVTLTGSNTLQARVEDSAGNFSTAKAQAYVLDKTAPTEAVSTVKFSADTGTSSSDFVTNTASQTISGTLNAALASGDVVKVSLNNGTTWQTATATTGSTTFSLSGVTLTGSNTLQARVEDSAGNFSTAKTQAYVLDKTAPTEAVSTVKFSADTGTSSSDFVTNTASQTISGTLNAALASGDVVKVSLNNGTTWQTATATTGSTTFSLSGVTLTGSNTLQARVEDSAGNFSTAKTQAYVLDNSAPPPTKPTEAVSTVKFSADTGTSSSDFVTNTASQTISGTLNAALASGDVVKVSLNNGTTWQTATATTGSTTFSLSGVTLTGSNTLQARVEDSAGNFSTAKTQAYVLDKTAPTEAVSTVKFSADTGTSSSDFVTNTASQTISGTLNAALASGDVVKVSLNNGTTWQTATATTGSTTFSLSGVTLTGSNTLQARVEDSAGNFSTAKTQAYVLDKTAPTEAVSTVKFSADTGTSSSDFVTNTASQTISGTLNAALASGDVVKVSLNNGTTWQTATATTGSTTFSLSGVTLTGSNTLQARVEDSAGNFSTAKTQAYVLDKTAPISVPVPENTTAVTKATATLTGGDGNDQLHGVGGNDVLAGHSGNDVLRGGNGWDILMGGPGSDVINGNSGKDYLHLDGTMQDYTFAITKQGTTITNSVGEADTVRDVEVFHFSDGTNYLVGRRGLVQTSDQDINKFLADSGTGAIPATDTTPTKGIEKLLDNAALWNAVDAASNNPTDADKALADLKQQLPDTFEHNGANDTMDDLAALLHLTHHE